MRKLFLYFLVLLVNLPSLVCAMPFCVDQQRNESASQRHCASAELNPDKTVVPMSMEACGQFDVALSSWIETLFHFEIAGDIEYDWVDTNPLQSLIDSMSWKGIRGSPRLLASQFLFSYPPLFRVTQRIRI